MTILKTTLLAIVFFRGQILTLFRAAKLAPRYELHGNLGRSDFTFNYSDQNWVLNIKFNIDDKRRDGSLAKEALKKILNKNYDGAFVNPVLLSVIVNSERGLIRAWESHDGINKGAARKSHSIDPPKPERNLLNEDAPKRSTPAELRPRAKAASKSSSQPRVTPLAKAEQKPIAKASSKGLVYKNFARVF
jgi:hypothetical protein